MKIIQLNLGKVSKETLRLRRRYCGVFTEKGGRVPEIASLERERELQRAVDDVLKTIQIREERILRIRFGFLDGRERTLEETGNLLGKPVSGKRISQIECAALRKLRHPSRAKYLRPFVNARSNPAPVSRKPPTYTTKTLISRTPGMGWNGGGLTLDDLARATGASLEDTADAIVRLESERRIHGYMINGHRRYWLGPVPKGMCCVPGIPEGLPAQRLALQRDDLDKEK